MGKIAAALSDTLVNETRKLQSEGYILDGVERTVFEELARGWGNAVYSAVLAKDDELRAKADSKEKRRKDVDVVIHIRGYTGTKKQLEITAKEVEHNFTLDSLTDFEMSLDPEDYEEIEVEIPCP